MENKILTERWRQAQQGEKNFWGSYTPKDLERETSERDSMRIKVIIPIWKRYIRLNNKIKILQIGAGPLDLINYIPFGKRYAIDPLADFYKENFKFDYGAVNYFKGEGENLPFKANYFDIIILSNVLDHTSNPDKVLSEINRVLKKQGILYFDCAYYQRGFLILTKIYGFFYKLFLKKPFNLHHPYMFSLKKIKNLSKIYFYIYEEKMGENIGIKIKNMKELRKLRMKEKLTKKIPALFGLLGNITYSFIGKKK